MLWRMVFLSGLLWGQSVQAAVEISPALLGMYRKTIEVDSELFTYAARYGVDHRLARAVILQESGGNAGWVSSDGDVGYFQLSPGLIRLLGVEANVDAGMKYIAQLQNQFVREDYVLAAYSVGPDRVQKDQPLRFRTLRYIVGVRHYRSVLREYEPEVRRQAEQLKLRTVQNKESWESLARAVVLPPVALRLYNPMLAKRSLRAGMLVAYPATVPEHLTKLAANNLVYMARIGDAPDVLASVFRIDRQIFHQNNDLWHLHPLPVGKKVSVSTTLVLKLGTRGVSDGAAKIRTRFSSGGKTAWRESARKYRKYTVRRGDSLGKIARRHRTTVTALRVANGLRSTRINAGTTLRIPASGRGGTTRYRVRWGDTLGGIARRYHTKISTLMRVNKLRSRRIQAGKVLRIPTS